MRLLGFFHASPGHGDPSRRLASRPVESRTVADEFNPAEMVARFRERAAAVRSRGIPPIEGAERRRFVEQAKLDYMDFAMIGDADASLDDGVLTLKVDLRPSSGSKGEDRDASTGEAPKS